jgi:hypothetical protein
MNAARPKECGRRCPAAWRRYDPGSVAAFFPAPPVLLPAQA